MTPIERMKILEKEDEAFEAQRAEIAQQHPSGHVLFQGGRVVEVFPSWDRAFDAAMQQFGRQVPFLIKEIGAEEATAPALVLGLIDSKIP